MKASSLKSHHIGKQFTAKADGQPTALQGGLSDYEIRKNRSGVPMEVIVYINGGQSKLRPDSLLTPIQDVTA